MYYSKILSAIAIVMIATIAKGEIRFNNRIPQNSVERDDLMGSKFETTTTGVPQDSAENTDDASFVIHLSNMENLKAEIMLEINTKLIESIQKAENQLIKDMSFDEKLRTQKTELLQDINLKMQQKLDKMLEKLKQGMEQQLTEFKDMLLQQMKYSAQLNPSKALATVAHPTTCAEAMLCSNCSSGIYTLYLPDLLPFPVYCLEDPYNGTAWAIIQRRQDGSIDFNRGWNAYARGFGDLNASYWIGLDRIYAMTNTHKSYELWIEMEDWENVKSYAKYDNFIIGSENEKYELKTLGKYSGNAGDSLISYYEGLHFTTKDSVNENYCAETYKGGFWWNNCGPSNINGLYLGNVKSSKWEGVHWRLFHGFTYSMRYIHMAIRPKK